MDKITASQLGEFIETRQLKKLSQSEQFEAFAAHCVVSAEYDDAFEPEDLRTGGGNDLGFDAVALIVNGDLVEDVEEIRDLKDRNNYLQARIIIVQARTTSGFTGTTITDLADNICDFFAETPTLPMNADVLAFKQLIDELYKHSTSFRRGAPDLVIRYVTTGTWDEDPHLRAKLNGAIKRLKSLNLFEEVSFSCFGAKEIQALYRQSENSVEASFDFPNSIVLPDIEGVEGAHIGIVKSSEYLKLITDSAGNIRRSLFYDNVRDFQDYNEVNRGIRETLASPEKRDRFVVLNNGITIVAREIQTTRNTFTLRDYQIVNGCQTSHVVFDERDNLGDSVYLSIKVIVTRDEDVASTITAATNKQTQVSDEDLQALENFQKELEDFFVAHPVEHKLYYERRSKQYASVSGLEKTRIITRPQLVRAYAAMFLDEPWRAGRYYRELQKIRKDEIFAEGDNPYPYYAAAVAYYRLDYFFRNPYVPTKYKPARYQLLMAIRHLIHGSTKAPTKKRDLEKYCERITDVLWDPTEGLNLVAQLLPLVDEAVTETEADGILDRDTVRTQTFTDLIAKKVNQLRAS
ncbi:MULTISPECIES: AIPR family protein [Streptosporangium]|uniref:Abortive phage infection protein C-terminal domain-containing protein n=1 Tax=Streptosporangium brasiliense TaxID=47480 RepID=A0ABT9R207_9ACTN|nr:AIPR family protein [Streptosporangium brasiliense]MDP9863266.1 hypothetical protein [Streptosporangium brasiliense]